MPTRSRVGAESYMRKRYQPTGPDATSARAASSRPAFRPMSLRVIELADRGRMFIRAAELARAAEALVLELRSEMEALRAHIEERQEVLRPAD